MKTLKHDRTWNIRLVEYDHPHKYIIWNGSRAWKETTELHKAEKFFDEQVAYNKKKAENSYDPPKHHKVKVRRFFDEIFD